MEQEMSGASGLQALQKWIRYPGPGEFRGQGKWFKLEDTDYTVDDFVSLELSGFLPTYRGDNPEEEGSVRPAVAEVGSNEEE